MNDPFLTINTNANRFREWLEQQPKDSIVGKPGIANSCPIHTWVISQGAAFVVIRPRGVLISFDGKAYKKKPLSAPLVRFLKKVDDLIDIGIQTITAEMALDIYKDCGDA